MMFRYWLFISVPLILSAFTHLWNPIGFPYPTTDEGTYLGRAMYVLDGLGPRDPYYGYDHPYFGHLFLAAALGLIGYPDSFNPNPNDIHSVEMLFLIPRILMGLLAVVDTFLIYKIAERRYNRNVAFIASILFAAMPITWLTRWIHLDSIQLPFLLLSILFALDQTNDCMMMRNNNQNRKNQIPTILLSGIFLGLAIFTKIPAFTLIPLVSFLVYTSRKNKRNLKTLGLWFIPVILIPLAWPAYALSVGEFYNWIFGVYEQTHRENSPLSLSIIDFFKIDPVLFLLGIAGLLVAAITRDFFILLLILPYLIFLYYVGFVTIFHLLPIIVGFTIAAGKLIVKVTKKTVKSRLLKVVQFTVISAVVSFSVVNTSMVINNNDTSAYFEAAAFASKYAQNNESDHKKESVTVISSPFFFWMAKYKFHLDNYIEWSSQRIKGEKVLSIMDNQFRKAISAFHAGTAKYEKIYDLYSTQRIATFASRNSDYSIDILLTDLSKYDFSRDQTNNLIDQNHLWKASQKIILLQSNNNLTIFKNTSNKTKEFNQVAVQTYINRTENPSLLHLNYASKSLRGSANFSLQIKDLQNHKFWTRLLDNTSGKLIDEIFVLPDYIIAKQIEVRVTIVTKGAGEHFMILKKAVIV